jgi:hypothetical protein
MKLALLTSLALAALVPALVPAATPQRSSAFRYCTDRDVCPLKFETDPRSRYVKDIRLYPKCAPVPTRWPGMNVRNGEFASGGRVRDVNGTRLTYSIEGRFTTPRKAVGTYRVQSRDCKDRPRKFVARRYGPEQPGI